MYVFQLLRLWIGAFFYMSLKTPVRPWPFVFLFDQTSRIYSVKTDNLLLNNIHDRKTIEDWDHMALAYDKIPQLSSGFISSLSVSLAR